LALVAILLLSSCASPATAPTSALPGTSAPNAPSARTASPGTTIATNDACQRSAPVEARTVVSIKDSPSNPGANPVRAENALAGTDTWRLPQPGDQVGDDASGQIKGYACSPSVNRGDSVTFSVSTRPAQSYSISFFRYGWYHGLHARLVATVGPLTGRAQPSCPADATTGLVECAWQPSYTLAVPRGWTSGVYLAVLTNERHFQNYMVFVVRDDAGKAALLVQQSVYTYQAYNNYPDDGQTGKSLYNPHSYGPDTITGGPRAVKVSFDRPYARIGVGQFLNWESAFVPWLEEQGYDVSYTTDEDTHANGARLKEHRGFLSVGHDEYWSRPMFDAAELARDAGVSLAFFGGNDVYWQVRLEPSSSGGRDRTLVVYKDAAADPVVDRSLTTVNWRDPPVNRPEQQLLGIQFVAVQRHYDAYRVANANLWPYAGTGLLDGSTIPQVVGDEADAFDPAVAGPPDSHVTILSDSPITDEKGLPRTANSSIYQAPSGALVFAAGSVVWAWAVGRPGYIAPDIQRLTKNILDRFVAPH
jgi:hypothetical protein